VSEPGSTPTTTDDAFLGGALQILQPQNGYRAGLDAVLLAAAAPAGPGSRMLDVGAGVGVVGLSIARRIPDARVTLVERDPLLAELARANIDRNRLSDRVGLIRADVAQPLGEQTELGALTETFDCVLANPPYHAHGRGTAARDAIKASANAMAEGDLDRWARFMAAMARPGGCSVLIHKAEALPDLIAAFDGRFGELLLVPIHPRAEAPASRVILRGIKGSRAPLQIRPGVVLHDPTGRFMPQVEAILRHGAALDLDCRP
jgi:tRNA1(Val) A37 N6-methylase TrmN6